MRPASVPHKRFLWKIGVPPKIINRLSAQAAYVISHDLVDGCEKPLGKEADQEKMVGALIDLGFDPDMVFKFSANTGRILLDCFDANVCRCPECGQITMSDGAL
jgi:hypothetical protein